MRGKLKLSEHWLDDNIKYARQLMEEQERSFSLSRRSESLELGAAPKTYPEAEKTKEAK